jgi:diadenosine tetraphosphatase ApaH/serine/threonine PP2A family protein phosphatase
LRYALISDIHSNLEALVAVVDALRTEAVDKYVCLGDIVGYAANPNECVEIVRDLSDVTILGNHDSAVVGATGIEGFNPLAAKAVLWTSDTISAQNREYLNSLAASAELEGALLVHSSPSNPTMWRYIFSIDDAKMEFHHFKHDICVVGHSHQPLTFIQFRDSVIAEMRPTVEIEKGNRYIINVGSVGQPRDLDPRAAYGLYDSRQRTLTVKRIEYDVQTTRQKIIEAGLPQFLGDRLVAGR